MTLILGMMILEMNDAPNWHYVLLTVIWIIRNHVVSYLDGRRW